MLNSITPTKAACRSIVLFVGFSDHRRPDVVRFGVAIFVLGIIIIIIVVGSRGGIVLPMMAAKLQLETFSGMPGVMSASCWMSRHSWTDVSAKAWGRQSVCIAAVTALRPGWTFELQRCR
jgi:hypothetical protein